VTRARRPPPARLDGRVRRGTRNRALIIDGMLEFIRERGVRPSAEETAARAGVGLRTVFRHFADMESLATEVFRKVQAEILPLIDAAPIGGSLTERVHELVRRRARVYERVGPFRRAARPYSRRSPTVRRRTEALDRWHRVQLEQALGDDIAGLDPPLRAVLDALTSYEAWDRLRTDQGLSRAHACRAIERGVLAVIAGRG
jgi:AcrR family transcriptional regulator